MSTPKTGTSPLPTTGSWSLVVTIDSLCSFPISVLTSHPQPLPWIPSKAVLKASLNLSSSPQVALICLTSSGAAELFASFELAGARFCQKSEWLMCPPALNLMPCCIATCEVMSEVDTASAWVLRRPFKLVMYV